MMEWVNIIRYIISTYVSAKRNPREQNMLGRKEGREGGRKREREKKEMKERIQRKT
jgi:hypothetical protein